MGFWSIPGLPPSIKFTGTHLWTWLESGTVRVKCIAQEHNTMSRARAWTQSTQSQYEYTNDNGNGMLQKQRNNVSGDRYMYNVPTVLLQKPFLYLALLKPPNDCKFHVRKWLARRSRNWRSPTMAKTLTNVSLLLDCLYKWCPEKDC